MFSWLFVWIEWLDRKWLEDCDRYGLEMGDLMESLLSGDMQQFIEENTRN